jgi:hypothetical protein
VALGVLAPATARSQGMSLTLQGGWRGGGSFIEAPSGAVRSVEPSPVLSVSLERAIDASRQVQLHVSFQDTEVFTAPPTATPLAASTPVTRLPLRLTTVHLGGTNFFDGPIGRGPFVAGGLGATLMSPGLAGTSTEAFFSFSVGLGYMWALAPNVALRVEARGLLVAVNGEGSLFCSGGCVVSLRGDAFLQGDMQVGLAIRF